MQPSSDIAPAFHNIGMSDKPSKEQISAVMRELGRKHGAKGGKKAAEKLTAEERSARAKKAVEAREQKKREKPINKG
jgi:hypothetical protein